MIEIYPNLFVGSEEDYWRHVEGRNGWQVVHAGTEPRINSIYTEPRSSRPVLKRTADGDRLVLNLVDSIHHEHIPRHSIDTALVFIDESLRQGFQTLVQCTYGASRSPGIAFLYLVKYTKVLPQSSFREAERVFLRIYRPYNPNRGFREFIERNWHFYALGER